VFFFPNETFFLMGGITGGDFSDVTFQMDGTLMFSDDIDAWPKDANEDVLECIHLTNIKNVKFTSSTVGVLDGQGLKWWGLPGIGYWRRGENRPRLFNVQDSAQILVENIFFLDSPYWTFWVHGVDGLEVRHSRIEARRSDKENHNIIDMTAFNTDGFDVSGTNVWIHDCEVWCQDDTIAVKGTSSNMLFERINASGVGLTIGSIGSSDHVRNITFRDSYMPNTYKGIYMKFRSDDASIEDILYENIVIDNPSQWPIWIGPAQQSDSSRLCAAHPCSICWPYIPNTECNAANSLYRNIVLKDITINNAKMSPGVILSGEDVPMEGVVFENVVFNNPGDTPWKDDYYYCEGVKDGVATGTTWPVPPCFEDRTDKALAYGK
jgi:polygalacturonase